MTTFKLTRIAPLSPTHQIEVTSADQGSNQVLEVTEMPTGSGNKYLIAINVGDLPPSQAADLLQKAGTQMMEFLGKDRVMIIPCGNEYPAVGIYALDPVEQG